MTALFHSTTIRRIESDALAGTAPGTLMARAASAVADVTERIARGLPAGRPVFAFCGPGNNGGDALLAVLLLRERGFDARAFELAGCAVGANPPADTARVRQMALHAGASAERIESGPALDELFARHDATPPLVLDGLFGIGLSRPLDGLAARLCGLLAALGATVIAIDVPSGINADTGAIVGSAGGSGGFAIRAALTVTMIGDKPGLHTGRAVDHAGRILVAPLGLAVASAQDDGVLFGRAEAAALLPARPRDSSKGTFGSVLVVGGAAGMTGAALLAARAAQNGGAGKVWIMSPHGAVFDPGQPQLMTRQSDAGFDGADVIVCGCGLGTDDRAQALLESVLTSPLPAVLDADALNLIAAARPDNVDLTAATHAVKATAATARPGAGSRILTPHPLEAARLADCRADEVQADRISAAASLARDYRAVVALKGAGTVVAAPDGRWAIVDAGGPALATAGTGDVLAGLIGSLVAQGLDPWDATLLGCWTHGNAGDRWSAAAGHAAGLSAAELPGLLRKSLAALAAGD